MAAPMPHKLGILVAIPIKGRRLTNRSGGKQSPYVQLRVSDQQKRTKASLIASVEPEWDQEVRFDVFHGQLNMHVALHDDGKKNELIGEGLLLLNEVIDKGELDVWFPIKYKGVHAGDIYFELTFYAAAPPAGPLVHPHRLPAQPGYMAGPRPLPPTPPVAIYPNMGAPHRPPVGYPVQHAQPYLTQQPFRPPSVGVPAPFANPHSGAPSYNQPFRPGAGGSPYGAVSHPIGPGGPRPYPQPMPQPGHARYPHQSPPPVHPSSHPPGGMQMPYPRPANPGYVGGPNMYPSSAPHGHMRPPGPGKAPPVTPLMQYNYSLGTFP